MSEFSGNDIKKGYLWSFISKFGVVAILFINNIVLSRLLMPEDFGSIAIVNIFIAISSILVESGFSSALIQRKAPTNTDYSSVFFFNIILSVTLYTLLYFSVTWITDFVKINETTNLLRALGLVLIINSLFTVQRNRLQKQMNFKKISIVEVSAALVGCITGILFAYNGYGVWSLIYYQLTSAVLSCILFWGLSGWRPSFVLSIKSLKSLFTFGGVLMIASLVETLYKHTISLILANRFTPRILGLYNQAFKLQELPNQTLASVFGSVNYPYFASLQNNLVLLKSKVRDTIKIASYISSVLICYMMMNAYEILEILYSSKWLEAGPYFQILCSAGILFITNEILNYLIKALGKSGAFFRLQLSKRILGILALIIAIPFGLYALVWVVAIQYLVWGLMNIFVTRKLIGYGFRNFAADVLPNVLTATISMVTTYLLFYYLDLSLYIHFVLSTITYGVIFCLISNLLKLKGWLVFSNLILRKLNYETSFSWRFNAWR